MLQTQKKILLSTTLVLGLIALYLVGFRDNPVVNGLALKQESSKKEISTAPPGKIVNTQEEDITKEAVLEKLDLSDSKKQMVFAGTQILFPMLSGINLDEVYIMPGIEVKNFFNEEKELSYFSPSFHNHVVVGVTIMRQYKPNQDMRLGQVIPVNEGWTTYPPISAMEAESTLIDTYDQTNYEPQGIFYLESGVVPYYLFTVPSYDNQFYFVNAYDKSTLIKNSRHLESVEQIDYYSKEFFPFFVNNEGLLELDENLAKDVPADILEQLRHGVAEENIAIKADLLKLDKDMNLIYDKRPVDSFDIPTVEPFTGYMENKNTQVTPMETVIPDKKTMRLQP